MLEKLERDKSRFNSIDKGRNHQRSFASQADTISSLIQDQQRLFDDEEKRLNQKLSKRLLRLRHDRRDMNKKILELVSL